MLRTRVLTALCLVPLVLAALLLLSPRAWGVAVLAVFLVAANEWGKLSRMSGPSRIIFVAVILLAGLGLLFLPAAEFGRGWPAALLLWSCGVSGMFWMLVAPLWVQGRWSTDGPGTMVVCGWIVLLGAWMAIVELQARSPWLALAAMAIVWIADTAAYFSGRALGRRKLAPEISPGKTWEGVYGGLAAVAIYAMCLLLLAHRAGWVPAMDFFAIVTWLGVMLVIAAISVIGDLYESLMKRHAGVKDSGTLLPGHGGILDRIDALLAAMPLAALAAQFVLVKT
jgi:phosphatidate cytidylyltransferase